MDRVASKIGVPMDAMGRVFEKAEGLLNRALDGYAELEARFGRDEALSALILHGLVLHSRLVASEALRSGAPGEAAL